MAKLSLCYFTIFSLLLSLSTAFDPEKPSDRRLLVILDDASLNSSHSIFFNSLKSRGYILEFKLADDRKIALQRYGHYLYDGLILFSPSAETVVIDHTSYSVSETDGDHSLIASDSFVKSDVILGREKIEVPVLFRGIAHSINAASSLAFKVLSASPAAYSANPNSIVSKPPVLIGTSISLVSVVQARNNARVLISGSLDMFSNRFFRSSVQKAGSSIKYEKSGNEQFLTELSKWMFHERGHLKAVNVRHHKLGETNEPSIYRINDELEYSVEMYEWSGTSWEPYVADDVQLQFYMMSPYVLKTLSNDKKGLFHTSFKVPDVYGVFQFKIDYQRLGYTSLSLTKQIPVRPYKHNEYERFIPVAFPYYGASFSTMAGFFVFSILYLYHK
ncbi:hypothetical protein BVRB_6g137840 isoform A [Beta vulgaris subsp. vulgaris]|nr:hypothetical protein BVRB_6g137840 isoform A [Beta vulgaris subsp. vulgaris]